MLDREGSVITEPREGAVRSELSRLLEGAPFCTSKRCSDFLKYVVENTISGSSGKLKERTIGVELFQLPPNYDTGQHAIVRVTANEVRKRLAQYYLAESGSSHPVRIDLPPGSYSAEFRWETPALEAPAPETHAPPAPPSRRARLVIVCVAAALVMVGAFSLWRWLGAKPA
jgi:hypothetical protein